MKTFIHFSKNNLNDLDFSLEREFLLANSAGAYCSSTIVNCNTRKYHGLLITPQSLSGDGRYVILSTLDEVILRGSNKFRLGTHRYPSIYDPEGYFFLNEFSYNICPEWIFRIDDIILKKEIILVKDDLKVLIRYTVIEAKNAFTMQFHPFLAFRNIHSLSKSNFDVMRELEYITGGIFIKIYPDFSGLFLQFSKKSEFVHAPDWYYNIEYNVERERGYEYSEDLYCPGYFATELKKGDQLVFSAGLTKSSSTKLNILFQSELGKGLSLENFDDCLQNSAKQFIIQRNNKSEIVAGFHWFGQWGRDTFIALPGLTLSTGHPEIFKGVINTMIKTLKNGLFPNTCGDDHANYNSADASLWFFWALQQYAIHAEPVEKIWNEYGPAMKSILESYREGTRHNIYMDEDGLIYAGEPGFALTWMDAIVGGKAVTPRIGKDVEINSLWYNAVCFSLEAATFANDKKFISAWEDIPHKIIDCFADKFWNREKGYLADFVNGNYPDWSLRPNQIFAVSLPYSPLTDVMKKSILEIVRLKLLTPRGLRTLAPDDDNYHGVYSGNQKERDLAYHQGTVWPWLIGHFSEAYLKVYGESGKPFIKSWYENFSPVIFDYGIGSIAEIYDGDQPHKARGAISQAWSVAELLRVNEMLKSPIPGERNKIKVEKSIQTL